MKNLGWLGVLPSACELEGEDDEGTPGRKMLGGRPPAVGGAGRPGRSEAGEVVDEAVEGEEEEGA